MTNSRSLSWIDRGRWAGLLAKVTDAPAGDTVPRPARPARPAAPVPAAPARRTPTAPPALPSAAAPPPRPMVPSIPVLPPPPPPPSSLPPLPVAVAVVPPPPPPPARPIYPDFSSASRNLEERLQALVAWIERCVPCRAAFIADDNGLPVVEHLGADAGQIAAASSILEMLASLRSLMRDSGGWLSLKLGAAVLHVVEIATPWGRFGIGVVTDDSLPREFLAALGAAVARAFLGDTEGEST
jgi:hypothetical protein